MSEFLNRLEKRFHRIAQLDHATTFLGWDQMVMMPNAGSQARGDAMAELASLRHEILTSAAMGDDLAEVGVELESGKLPESKRMHIKEIQRHWRQAKALPATLVHAQVLAGTRCEHGWRTQRRDNDWRGFLENFRAVVDLSREEAQCRQSQRPDDFETPYDAMLDLHCAGDSQALIADVFSALKNSLPDLLQQVMDRQASEKRIDLSGHYPTNAQKQLSESLMNRLGFDFNAGRLDVSLHPFSTGVRGDHRITTRFRETDFADALQATAHETGHASYEAGLPEKWQSFPVGLARNMCIHESQSLYFEKQVFLSRAFGRSFIDTIHQHLPGASSFSADDIWHAQTIVKPSYIRVEADEITYPLHVMLRYDIESALINGDIEPDVIPELWESSLQRYLGLSINGDHAKGCLQDIHWTDGAFGYFPSYTMGAVNAAQIAASIKQQYPDWQQQFAQGNTGFARQWLSDNIWTYGSHLSSQELMKQATGSGSDASFLLEHLHSRYIDTID